MPSELLLDILTAAAVLVHALVHLVLVLRAGAGGKAGGQDDLPAEPPALPYGA